MKKFLVALLCALSFACLLTACGEEETTPPPSDNAQQSEQGETQKKTITGVTFSDERILQDGTEHTLTVTGTLPEGVSVSYTGNVGTNPGTYQATATLSGEGYTTLVLHATLEIYTNPIQGITFSDKKVLHDGRAHSITVEGTLPEGVSVSYSGNVGTDAGVYNATATLSGIGYTTLVLNAKLEIYTVSAVAKDIINSIMSRPEPWSFLPEGLHEENMAYNSLPVNDFTDFVETSSIGKKTIGKQLNVLYDTLDGTETVLKYFDTVYTAIDTIASAYQNFINTNPENYKSFEGEAAGFKIKITLNDTVSTLLAGNSAVSIELSSNSQTGVRYGRIQATNGFALKYETTNNGLKLALKGTVKDVGFLRQLEFVRNVETEKVTGYLTEFMGAESAAIKTKALLYADANRTVIMSNKRETDDMKIHGYEEIYNSQTGEMLGGEVTETISSVAYDTLWFPMNKVTGITSVKAINKSGVSAQNQDDIYVNGSANVLETKKVGGLSLKNLSRRYDIEMKDVWYIVKESDGNDGFTYRKEKCSVPMLCIQTEQYNTFSTDIVNENDGKTTFATTPTASSSVKGELTANFEPMYEVYETLKEQVTFQEINAYIGSKNSFFENEE